MTKTQKCCCAVSSVGESKSRDKRGTGRGDLRIRDQVFINASLILQRRDS